MLRRSRRMGTEVQDRDAGQDAAAPGPLFEGVVFWLSATVPSKRTYAEQIRMLTLMRSNGGIVTLRDADATLKIADHLKPKYAPVGSLSYTYIDASLREGELADLQEHRIGAPTTSPRPVADPTQPAKFTRNTFTAEDDVDLVLWVRDYAKSNGGKSTISGNELYKQLEQINPRHPWQSWRDRYLKKLRNSSFTLSPHRPQPESHDVPNVNQPAETAQRARSTASIPGGSEQQGSRAVREPKRPAPATSGQMTRTQESLFLPADEEDPEEPDGRADKARSNEPAASIGKTTPKRPESGGRASGATGLGVPERQPGSATPTQIRNERNSVNYTEADYKELRRAAEDILQVDPAFYENAWDALADNLPRHTASEWRYLWETKVKPEWVQADSERAQGRDLESVETEETDEDGVEYNDEGENESTVQDVDETDVEAEAETDGEEFEGFEGFERFEDEISVENDEAQFVKGSQQQSSKESSTGSKHPHDYLKTSKHQYSRANIRDAGGEASNKRIRLGGAEKDEGTRRPNSRPETQYFSASSMLTNTLQTNMVGLRETSGGQNGSQATIGSIKQGDGETSRNEYHSVGRNRKRTPTPSQDYNASTSQEQADDDDDVLDGAADEIDVDGALNVHDLSREELSRNLPGTRQLASTSSMLKGNRESFHPGAPRRTTPTQPADSPSTPDSILNALMQPSASRNRNIAMGWTREDEPTAHDIELAAEPFTGQATETVEDYEQDMRLWEQSHLNAGVPQEIVYQAVDATSGILQIADDVIRSLQAGLGIPRGIKGIWTEDDDRLLGAGATGDGSALVTVVQKHGEATSRDRFEYLKAIEEEND